MDIDPLIQLQMVRDHFIDGQPECALRRHLDSLGPDTPMADIVDVYGRVILNWRAVSRWEPTDILRVQSAR